MSSDLSDGDSSELVSDSESESNTDNEEAKKNEEQNETQNENDNQEQVEDQKELLRFQQELEFVLCLANPRYIYSLAQRNYFGDPNFINFLKYLLYWCKPEYAKYIRFPQAIQFLKYLQDPDFRKYVSNFNNILHIENTQFKYWEFYQRNRLDITLPSPELKKPDSNSQ
ncbi:Mediator of RNA polymerase II transcription subunit 31 [Tritrichomonas musculus]|uniref:Mediator of RNA polymerase II transcription subunit 31 n=1 Tax=Tritrichomonas musculus TaxID=1915356 RepID=A0ABR2INW6_9EUKA